MADLSRDKRERDESWDELHVSADSAQAKAKAKAKAKAGLGLRNG